MEKGSEARAFVQLAKVANLILELHLHLKLRAAQLTCLNSDVQNRSSTDRIQKILKL